jgi:metallo-beta-lactamase class B
MGVNAGTRLVNNPQVPDIADEYRGGFKVLRGIACDVPLGSHPAMYNLAEKYAKVGKGANPFIDPAGYKTEVDIEERAFLDVLDQQQKEASAKK